ncbi:sterile alpha motif (SAM) domain-containing protein [Actinidia rufa]|uniref:Sterile alpha motif (SAM) domain-containing protein n=1 Tax=Actinidia rufa TaxID=165716 RepID=A0A7J0GM92_9ERIC|nr:sterile alpha motif (SAM) domain-containing protein [Actinidia rufa]
MAEIQLPDGHMNGGGPLAVASTENVVTKRQRRPSVRLGDIGDQAYDALANRRTKQWKLPAKDSGKGSRTRALTNLEYHETLNVEDREGNLDAVAIGSWRVKESKYKRGSTKRVRSNWISKADDGDGDDKFSGGEDVDDGFRDFDPELSESPIKEQSPINSLDNLADDENRGHVHGKGRGVRVRVSECRDHNDGVELEGPSDTDARNWNRGERNGVRVWLNQLGLGRYAPVFEIHEVDDEVLPMLTLEDLKDMGINAVGTRRKMYCAIQKLSKGFS